MKGERNMNVIYCDDVLSLPRGPREAVCVTTNGMVRADGRAVMGRGIAKEADDRFHLAADLARLLKRHGNRAFDLGVRSDGTGHEARVLTLPTKGDWRMPSDPALVRRSLAEVVRLCDDLGVTRCYLPCPGCANGGLDWKTQVRPICEELLDDRFTVADRRFRPD